jgi:hypothetical protein
MPDNEKLTQDDKDYIATWGRDSWSLKKQVERKKAEEKQARQAKEKVVKVVEESHRENMFQIEQDLEKRISELKKEEAELEDKIDANQEQLKMEKEGYEKWLAENEAKYKNEGWVKIEPYPKGMSIEAYNEVFTATAYVLAETQKLQIGEAKRWYSIHKGSNNVEIICASEPVKETDLEVAEKSLGVLNSEIDIWQSFMRALGNPKVKKFMLVVSKEGDKASFNFVVL